MVEAAAFPLPLLIRHAERRPQRETTWTRLAVAAEAAVLAPATRRRAARLTTPLEIAQRRSASLTTATDAALRTHTLAARAALHGREDWTDEVLGEALAVVQEASARVLGQRPYDVQLLGAHAALRGMAAEMATGEGKTLAAGIAASIAALAGIPVHLVTVNPYLAERDAAAMTPLYSFLGLSCGIAAEGVPLAKRQDAYRCDITVCTGKDLAFDYMRDRLRSGRRVGELRSRIDTLARRVDRPGPGLLRGLHFAIVDEADSVLIDEARTPLILARDAPDERDPTVYDRALELAAKCRLGVEYRVFANERRVALLPAGRTMLAMLDAVGRPWDEPVERERLLTLALTALHTLIRDEHYLVTDGKADIVDEFTGRTMADRSWSDGLQEMVDRKEGLPLSPSRVTEARMTFQRFFRRYRRLAGMSGTLHEVSGELWRIYRLPVARIPTHRADAKTLRPACGHASETAKWRAVAAETAQAHSAGAPVLIGCRTVAASAAASRALSAAHLPHVVLSAAQPREEADIVARAGERGAITVATNMAGRGTDIRLLGGVEAAGGLHVLISEPNEARRIDRQLAGRCGRQGDPGLVAAHVCLEDALLQRHCPQLLLRFGRLFPVERVVLLLSRLAQKRAERLHARMRRNLMRADEWLGDAIAFAGEAE